MNIALLFTFGLAIGAAMITLAASTIQDKILGEVKGNDKKYAFYRKVYKGKRRASNTCKKTKSY